MADIRVQAAVVHAEMLSKGAHVEFGVMSAGLAVGVERVARRYELTECFGGLLHENGIGTRLQDDESRDMVVR